MTGFADILNFSLLETVANKWERLADEETTNEAIYKGLIDMNHEVREVIVRLKGDNLIWGNTVELANTFEKEYENLLRLAKNTGKKPCDIILKKYLCSHAKGLRRIKEALQAEFVKSLSKQIAKTKSRQFPQQTEADPRIGLLRIAGETPTKTSGQEAAKSGKLPRTSRQTVKEKTEREVEPIDTESWWSCKNLKRLRDIDIDCTGKGIVGTSQLLKDMKKYLKNHKRADIADTLNLTKERRIVTTMHYKEMFLQK